MGSVRVAIVGVGNCATSLIQGVEYYQDADPDGHGARASCTSCSATTTSPTSSSSPRSTSTPRRSASTSSEAINASENNTIKIADVPPLGVDRAARPHPRRARQVLPRDHRGVRRRAGRRRRRRSRTPRPTCWSPTCPVGSEEADKFYAQCAIDAGVAFVNALPVFIASDPVWAKKFEDAGVPIVGDDIKSQVGATITHRVMAKLFEDRGVVLDRTYQLNVGGNMDFKNMLERERLESKKISKTQAVTSNLEPRPRRTATCTSARPTTSQWLDDRKWAYVRLEGRAFGDVPLNLEYKLEVWDSPNSAGIIIDAVRAAKIAKDRGTRWPDHLRVVVPHEVPAGAAARRRGPRTRRGLHPRRGVGPAARRSVGPPAERSHHVPRGIRRGGRRPMPAGPRAPRRGSSVRGPGAARAGSGTPRRPGVPAGCRGSP